jgi:hypothetical protein
MMAVIVIVVISVIMSVLVSTTGSPDDLGTQGTKCSTSKNFLTAMLGEIAFAASST